MNEAWKEDWTITAKDHVGTRIVFFFASRIFPDVVEVRISVSRTFADPEQQAWRVLDAVVK